MNDTLHGPGRTNGPGRIDGSRPPDRPRQVGEPELRRTLAPLYRAAYLLVLVLVGVGVLLSAAGWVPGVLVAVVGVALLLATPVVAALAVGARALGRRDRRLLWVVLGIMVILGGQLLLQLSLPYRVPPGAALRYPAAERIVAIGDLHGDLAATRAALRLAGAIDEQGHWVGGRLVVVQIGDQIDRGDDDRLILDYLDELAEEAWRAGGALHILNGNHEVMNARLDLRYLSDGGAAAFSDFVPDPADSLVNALPPERQGRGAAFRPGAPYARMLAERNLCVVIGENVFVHAGILPEHLDYGLERMNAEVRAWLSGEGAAVDYIHKGDSIVWTRHYSDDPDSTSCADLGRVLEELGAARMIMGHTVQRRGITSYCDGRAWCIDVGLAAYYGSNAPQVLEIRGDQVRILRSDESAVPPLP